MYSTYYIQYSYHSFPFNAALRFLPFQFSAITELPNHRNRTYTIEVSGQASLNITTTGGTGDADLYVKYGEKTRTDLQDTVSSRGSNNNENVIISPTQAGNSCTYFFIA